MVATGNLTHELEILAERLQSQGDGESAATVTRAVEALRQYDAATARSQGMLTTTEAASLLGVRSVNTVKRWASDGLLEGYRVGSRVLVSRRSVERMLQDAALTCQRDYERNLEEALAPFDCADDNEIADLTGMAHRGRKPWAARAAAEC